MLNKTVENIFGFKILNEMFKYGESCLVCILVLKPLCLYWKALDKCKGRL